MKIKCAHNELVEVDKLILLQNPKNNNQHPKEQIERLAKIIDFAGQRSPIVISKRSGFIVKGHARLHAIAKLGWKEAAVDYQDYNTEAEEYQDMTADNEIARWAEFNKVKFLEDIKTLDLGDLDLLGIKDLNLNLEGLNGNSNLDESSKEELNNYSKKIASPIYTPKKDQPPEFEELFDTEKYEVLVKEIKEKKLPKELETFLISAASRHIVFNYENIAEFYCHQNKDVQDLMEKSALVIIDFNKAIENGFVKLTQEIQEIIDENEVEEDEQD